MVLSLLTRRTTLGEMVSVAARTIHPAVLRIVARRTLFVTPQLNIPPATASEGTTKKIARKIAEKESENTPLKRGPGSPRKNHQELKEGGKRICIPKELKPPKRGPGPYVLFYSSWLKSQSQPSTLEEYQQLSKQAGELWKSYSMAEKQQYYDESEVRKADAKRAREEFFRNQPLSDLRHLNAMRKAQGKPKYHSTKMNPTAPTAFIQFSSEFRNSVDGQSAINELPSERTYAVRAVVAAANRWRVMSEGEKAPYYEKYRKAKEEIEAEQGQT